MSVQSLFLAVGAILLGDDSWLPFFAVATMAVVATWWVFFPVIFARTAIVDFHKFSLGSRFDRHGRPLSDPVTADGGVLAEREYAAVWRGRRLRRAVYRSLSTASDGRFVTLRQTRRKLDLYLPALVTIVWAVFIAQAVMRL